MDSTSSVVLLISSDVKKMANWEILKITPRCFRHCDGMKVLFFRLIRKPCCCRQLMVVYVSWITLSLELDQIKKLTKHVSPVSEGMLLH